MENNKTRLESKTIKEQNHKKGKGKTKIKEDCSVDDTRSCTCRRWNYRR
jgi:hypothetical protein